MDVKKYHNAVMVNRVPCRYMTIDESSGKSCRESLESYFSLYEGKITDICLGIHEQTPLVQSKSLMGRGEKYLKTDTEKIPYKKADQKLCANGVYYYTIGAEPLYSVILS